MGSGARDSASHVPSLGLSFLICNWKIGEKVLGSGVQGLGFET